MKKYQFSVKKFRPSLLFSCVLAFLFSAGAMVIVATDFGKRVPRFAQYIVFVAAALFLTLAVWAMIVFCKTTSPGRRVNELAHRVDFFGKLVDNYAFRTVAFTYLSLGMNILFALAKGVAGWFSTSWWLITLSVYYLILCVAKFVLLKDSRKLDKAAERTN